MFNLLSFFSFFSNGFFSRVKFDNKIEVKTLKKKMNSDKVKKK